MNLIPHRLRFLRAGIITPLACILLFASFIQNSEARSWWKIAKSDFQKVKRGFTQLEDTTSQLQQDLYNRELGYKNFLESKAMDYGDESADILKFSTDEVKQLAQDGINGCELSTNAIYNGMSDAASVLTAKINDIYKNNLSWDAIVKDLTLALANRDINDATIKFDFEAFGKNYGPYKITVKLSGQSKFNQDLTTLSVFNCVYKLTVSIPVELESVFAPDQVDVELAARINTLDMAKIAHNQYRFQSGSGAAEISVKAIKTFDSMETPVVMGQPDVQGFISEIFSFPFNASSTDTHPINSLVMNTKFGARIKYSKTLGFRALSTECAYEWSFPVTVNISNPPAPTTTSSRYQVIPPVPSTNTNADSTTFSISGILNYQTNNSIIQNIPDTNNNFSVKFSANVTNDGCLSEKSDLVNRRFDYSIGRWPDQKIRVLFDTVRNGATNTRTIISDITIPSSTWVDIALVKSGASTNRLMSLYLDGRVAASYSFASNEDTIPWTNRNLPLYVGGNLSLGGSDYGWRGLISQYEVSRGSLTQKPGTSSGLQIRPAVFDTNSPADPTLHNIGDYQTSYAVSNNILQSTPDTNNNFSVLFWAKGNCNGCFTEKSDLATSPRKFDYSIGRWPDQKIRVLFDTVINGATNTRTIISDITMPDNTWQHIALVQSGSNSKAMSLYLNGRVAASYQMAANESPIPWTNRNLTAYVGGNPQLGTNPYGFSGQVSNYEILKGSWSEDRIKDYILKQRLYSSTQFDGKAGVRAQDTVDNSTTYGYSTSAFITSTPSNSMTTGLLIPAQGTLSVSNSNFNNLENNDFTIMAWICSTNAPGGGFRNFFQKGASVGQISPAISLNLNQSNNAIARMLINGSSYSLQSIRQVATNEWQHVAFSKSGPIYSLYVNGHLDAQTNIPGNFNASASAASRFLIAPTDVATRALNDTIANLDIYNAPLDPEIIHYSYARKTANFKMISNTDPSEVLEPLTLDANGHVNLYTDLPWTNTAIVQCCYGDQDGRYLPYQSSSNTISVLYTPSPGYTNESSICVQNGDNYLKIRIAATNNIP